MKQITRKKHIAIAVSTAITLIGLSACSTQEPKVASEKREEPEEISVVVINDVELSEMDKKQLIFKHRAERAQKSKGLLSTPALAMKYAPPHPLPNSGVALNRENYKHFDDNGIELVTENPVSTFSIDVDTGSYTNVRRLLNDGALPRKDAVRAEEFINYFAYDFAPPENNQAPFAVHTEMMTSPWNKDSYLLQVGIKAWEPVTEKRPAANLVFLVDVSGSMNSADKLGLLKKSLSMLTRQMSADDRISIVVYAGASGVVLEPTAGNQTSQIEIALERLQAGGSTNGGAGILLAYQLAEKAFIKDGINRILLATDGDFNVGTTNFDSLIGLVEEKRKSGIALSTFGFGSGNYNDHLMEQLADKGNGQYSYIDSLLEAKKVLVDQMNSSLMTVAGDVKIQLEFNPQQVSEYRLIGYENRNLAREDFNNDKVDAGDIGAGHTVTALYEIKFSDSSKLSVDALRYGNKEHLYSNSSSASQSNIVAEKELGFLKLRYKEPGSSTSNLIKKVLNKQHLMTSSQKPSNSIRFAASVAAFAQQLRGGKYLNDFNFQQINQLAQTAKGDDVNGLRSEFVQLVSLAELMSQKSASLEINNSPIKR